VHKRRTNNHDSINQLDVADGLKELLIGKGFGLKWLLDTPVSGLAKMLGIDNYVSSIIHHAARKVQKTSIHGTAKN
jgi:hypothetical protein